MISAEDAEAIERATLEALPPLRLEHDDGWFLAANAGAVGRANSVTPLWPGTTQLEARIDRALAFYARENLPPAFRVSPFSQPSGLTDALSQRGFAPEETTLVMTAEVAALTIAAPEREVDLIDAPLDAWAPMFMADGGDPDRARARAETLARGEGSLFAEARMGEDLTAIGVISVDGAWAGVHGMRTTPAHRGRGLARAVLKRLVDEAEDRGATRFYLQVEETNATARRLYERAGFTPAYAYSYWRPSR